MKRWNLIAFWGLLPLALLFLSLGALRLQAAPAAATVVVDTLVDENDGSCVDGDCSLRDAIETAAANDTIIFDNGLAGGTINVSPIGTLVVNKDLTISGTVPITISGNNLVRVFEVAASTTATFNSLTIADGRVTVPDCPFKTWTFICGGGINILNDSDVTVSNVLFINNTANLGAAIHLFAGEIHVYNSTFISNTGNAGGGIFVRSYGQAFVHDSTFISNTVADSGGAIDNGNGAPLFIYDSYFADNSADYGGAISGAGGTTINIINSTLNNNYARYGGAIIIGVSNSNLTIRDSALFGNVANNSGGAIYSQITGDLLIENSTITGNSSLGGSEGGGGVAMAYGSADNVIRNSTIVSNNAPYIDDQDGLWMELGTLTVRNSIVAHNGKANCSVTAGTFDGGSSNIADDNSCSGFIFGDPMIGPLVDNGGGTFTHALLYGSPAIDSGDNGACLPEDQRGVPRPQDGDNDGTAVCDMGAYEYEYVQVILTNFLSAIFKD